MKYKLADFTTEIVLTDQKDLADRLPKGSLLLVDEIIVELYPELIKGFSYIKLKALESNKTLKTAQMIIDWLIEHKANRHSTICGIGGGLITDLAGWVASIYMRGCHLVLIPTTIIGMIDASVGGKTALNYRDSKNLLGCFYPAEKVMINSEFIKSLSERNLLAGEGELIKTSLLANNHVLNKLTELGKDWRNEPLEFIKSALNYKLGICSQDLRDSGKRRYLNLGHTFAHVIESVSNFEITHGQAVAIGITRAARLSWKLKLIDKKRLLSVFDLMKNFFSYEYLNLSQKIKDQVENGGEAYFTRDKKAMKKPMLILFKDNDQFTVSDDAIWKDVKTELFENIDL